MALMQIPAEIDSSRVPEMNELVNQPTLWETIQGMTRGESEAGFIRDVIGEEKIVANERARNDVFTYLGILADMRERNENHDVSSALSFTTNTLLIGRLKALVTSLGIEPLANTPREKIVMEFISSGGARPRSAARPLSRASVKTSPTSGISIDSRPTSAMSTASSRSVHVDPHAALTQLQPKIRFHLVHEIKTELQHLFESEREMLVEDVEMIRAAIDDEIQWMTFAHPTTTELQGIGSKLDQRCKQAEHEKMISALPSPSTKKPSLPKLKQ